MPTRFDFLSPGVNIREVDRSILPADAVDPGPILIGRAQRGPSLQPIQIRTYEDFVSVFGEPVLGSAGANTDVWRQGNIIGPQYAGIAAQAHLASQTTPVTFVRLLGDNSPNASAGGGTAGWNLGTLSSDISNNQSAYGLFLVNSGTVDATTSTGSLAAVFYATDGAITLSGTIVDSINVTSSAGTLIQSQGGYGEFKVDIWNNGATSPSETVVFNFNEDDQSNYVRSMFSTNPILTNSEVTTDTKDYWLGETFDRFAKDNVSNLSSGDSGKVYGIILPLQSGSVNWGDHKESFKAPTSGWVIAADTGPAASYDAALAQKLFRFVGLHEGEKLQQEVMIAVENITAPVDVGVNPYGSFDVCILDRNGAKLESMIGCNLNPQSDNYIVKMFGNIEYEWIEAERRYRAKGSEENVSNYFRVEVSDFVKNGTAEGSLPFGFLGPVRPKGFTLVQNSTGVNAFGTALRGGTKAKTVVTFGSSNAGHKPNNGETLAFNILGTTKTVVFNTGGTDETAFQGDSQMEVDEQGKTNNQIVGIIKTALDALGISGVTVTHVDNSGVSDQIIIESNSVDSTETVTATLGGSASGNLSKADTAGVDDDNDFAGAFVKGNTSMPGHGGSSTKFANLPTNYTASFRFPAIALRNNGTEGSPVSAYEVYYGIRPKTAASSTRNDAGYVDYLRRLPVGVDSYQPGSHFEHSFVFSLDDLVVTPGTRTVTYTSGSRALGTSYTATSGSAALLNGEGGASSDDNVEIRQFVMPVWGGFDGLDITEKEPFKNDRDNGGLAADSQTDTNNAMLYSVNKAIDSIKDGEQVIANSLSIPGVWAPRVTDKIISTCEARKDLLGIIDLENAFDPDTEGTSETYYTVQNVVSKVRSRKLNTSYACTFHPWVQVQTNTGTNSGKLYVPPSVAAVGAFARSEAQSALWFAPAGFTRGGLNPLGGAGGPRVTAVRDVLSSKDRDKLYDLNINPIASFPGEGIVVFGQKTLQSTKSALDRINVRRLLIFLKYEISKIARNLLFEPNVDATWGKFKNQADGLLSNVKTNFGITEYLVVLDETTTTPDLIDRNVLYTKIYIKPARAIEYIVVDLIVTNTGAEFV